MLNAFAFLVALSDGEVMHAMGHVAAGIGLFMWIRSLSEQIRDQRLEDGDDEIPSGGQERIAGLESEVDQLRRELSEAQERLDFTERLMAQRQRADAVPSTPDRR